MDLAYGLWFAGPGLLPCPEGWSVLASELSSRYCAHTSSTREGRMGSSLWVTAFLRVSPILGLVNRRL